MNNKHTYVVREICKFLAGLICADIIAGLWFWSAGMVGTGMFFGLLLTTPLVNTWLAADCLLLLVLIFYGWSIKLPVSSARRALLVAVGVLLSLVAIAHFARLIFAVPIAIGGLAIPFWISVLGAIITAFLAYASFHLAAKK